MDKVDPEKILAELEVARQAIVARRARPERRILLMMLAFLILAIAAIALWVLAMKLEPVPRPMEKNIQYVGSASSSLSPVFPEILLCPARTNFLTSPPVVGLSPLA